MNFVGEGSNASVENQVKRFDTTVGCALNVMVSGITSSVQRAPYKSGDSADMKTAFIRTPGRNISCV
jgi:hypothetical protein